MRRVTGREWQWVKRQLLFSLGAEVKIRGAEKQRAKNRGLKAERQNLLFHQQPLEL